MAYEALALPKFGLGVSETGIPEQADKARQVITDIHNAEVANQGSSAAETLQNWAPGFEIAATLLVVGAIILGVGRMMGKAAKD